MFIEIIIHGSIVKRVEVKQSMTGYSKMELYYRERSVQSYLMKLRALYPKADFQLAFESKMHLIEITE